MSAEELDRAFGKTPASFSKRVDASLRGLKEDKPVKKLTLRTVLVAALLVLLLCGIAYAVITQGQEWYYNNRFTAYQEHEPDKHEAIMSHLKVDPPQEGWDDEAVSVTVQDVAWVPEKRALTLSIAAVPKEPDQVELHPMWNLDADGSYVGDSLEDYEDDGEARAEHWLWTAKGCGPVTEFMENPSKKLVLFEADEVYIGTPEGVAKTKKIEMQCTQGYTGWSPDGVSIVGDGSSMDAFDGDGGTVITVLEMQMDFLKADYERDISTADQMDDEWKARQIKWYHEVLDAFARYTDENGMLTLCVPYEVTEYVDDDAALYSGGKTGYLTFQVDVSGTDARLAAALSTGEPSDGRYETLRPGDSGEAVERLQKALMEWEPNVVSVTGTYDDGTRHAVDLYQQAQGIPGDGIAGPTTQAALFGE